MTKKFVVSLIFAVIVAIFAVQNAVSVTVKFLFAEFTISQALIILISAVFGAVIVFLLGMLNQMKTNKQIKGLTKENNELQEEIKSLKEEIENSNKMEVEDINKEKNMKDSKNKEIENKEDQKENDLTNKDLADK